MTLDELVTVCHTYWTRAQAKYPVIADFDLPPVIINSRLRTTAGRCFYQRTKAGYICVKVDFNKTLMEANKTDFIVDTIPHELAHAMDKIVFNNKGHGSTWRECFRAITNGREPTRCHSMDVSAVITKRAKPKTTTMRCACKEWEFTPQRMAWVKKGKVYFCPDCKSNIIKWE